MCGEVFSIIMCLLWLHCGNFVVNKKPIKQLILNRLWYVLNCGYCGFLW